MPATYAHLAMVRFASASDAIPKACRVVVNQFPEFVEMGSVSPDYPYLEGESSWANLMHYTRTGQMIEIGSELLRREPDRDPFGEFGKKFAWLAGYAAHVVGDLTIHPVVMSLVGDYEENKREHRLCEVHQDAYIFRRLGIGDIRDAEFLSTGIKHCSGADAVIDFWDQILKTNYPEAYVENKPDVALWHKFYGSAIDHIAEETNRFLVLSWVARMYGFIFPTYDQVETTYIHNLPTPSGERLNYDVIFDRAVHNVVQMWIRLSGAIFGMGRSADQVFKDWNLDTGRHRSGYEYW